MKNEELWYEVRDGQYFCKACNRPLTGVTVKDAFVLNAPSVATHYSCDGCHKNVMLPSPR